MWKDFESIISLNCKELFCQTIYRSNIVIVRQLSCVLNITKYSLLNNENNW